MCRPVLRELRYLHVPPVPRVHSTWFVNNQFTATTNSQQQRIHSRRFLNVNSQQKRIDNNHEFTARASSTGNAQQQRIYSNSLCSFCSFCSLCNLCSVSNICILCIVINPFMLIVQKLICFIYQGEVWWWGHQLLYNVYKIVGLQRSCLPRSLNLSGFIMECQWLLSGINVGFKFSGRPVGIY